MNQIEELKKQVEMLTKRVNDLEKKKTIVPNIYNLQNSYDKMLEATCKVLSISTDDFFGRKRNRSISLARHIVCYIGTYHMGLSTTELARRIKRDHSTVIHSRNAFRNFIDMNYDTEINYYSAVLNHIS